MNMRYRAIAAALVLAFLGSVGFMIAYATDARILWQGLALAGALVGFVLAVLGWSSWIIGADQVVDTIDAYPSTVADRDAAVRELQHSESEVSRRGALLTLLIATLGVFGIAALFPFRSWGPAPGSTLLRTKWKRGDRMVRENGEIVTIDSLNVDSVVTVFPEDSIDDPSSETLLIRLPPDVGDGVQGYIAYSKICTHAGCPVALYRAAAHQLLCPCHQSVFDVVEDGKVLSGPADHALPRLPIAIDARGFLRAQGDYPSPVGPGFWERG